MVGITWTEDIRAATTQLAGASYEYKIVEATGPLPPGSA